MAASAIAVGYAGKARAPMGSAIYLAERDDSGEFLAVFASRVGDNGIKPDTWYTLKDGKPVAVSE
ncbi:hypothetical protein [Pseudoxanthomonas kalamensis]|uniref:hypothetical protein n=1 Tax=Pseudoxanthomonas kalamensis TaxID=289483 RepID=UPI001B86BE8D|nr:hypothetical protein [Pseudoxanthomonas kalamensis]